MPPLAGGLEGCGKTMADSSRRFWFILVILIQVFIGTGGGVWAAYISSVKRAAICPGVDVSGVDIGGMNLEEARAALEEELEVPPFLSLSWEGETFTIPLYPEVAGFDLERALRVALNTCGRYENNYFFNLVRWFPRHYSLTVPLFVSPEYLAEKLSELADCIEREPVNAKIIIRDGKPEVTGGEVGYKLDPGKSKEIILDYLARGDFKNIPLQVNVVYPEVRAEELPDFSFLLASFETLLDKENTDRNHNILLATEKLNGMIIDAGEIFSFNEALGEVTAEKDYREVLVIQNRKFVPGIGGGICQVATTIYQVALRAGLKIIQRSNHSRPVSYVPLGQDATVAYGLLDLQFRNNLPFPIMLVGAANSTLKFSLFGAEPSQEGTVEIVSEVVEILPPRLLEQPEPNLPKGARQLVQQGEEGYRVKVYRVVYQEGVEKSRELVSTDVYLPINEVVRVGTREVGGKRK